MPQVPSSGTKTKVPAHSSRLTKSRFAQCKICSILVCQFPMMSQIEGSTMTPIKVVVADDHALFRDGLRKILSAEKDILVIGEAANGDETSKISERMKPDILLLDLKMPKGDVVQN